MDSSYLLISGEVLTSNDLLSLVNKSRQIKKIIHSLPAKYNHGLAESACLSGGFQQPIEMKESKLKEISMRLTKQHNDLEADWESSYDQENGLYVTRKIRGVVESLSLGKGIFSSSDSRRLNNLAEDIKKYFPINNERSSNIFERNGKSYPINGPLDLIESIFEEGRKGLQIQRYKGLGEMNADQLWETTLDPDGRRLLKVKIDSSVDNSGIFADLMGDEVIKRREFIQDSITSGDLAVNLDI